DLALADLQHALEIRERLAKDHPSVREHQRNLAVGLNNIGLLHGDMDHPDLALASFQRALRISERLVKDYPSIADYRDAPASTYNTMGALQNAKGHDDLPPASFQQAIKVRDRLAKDFKAPPPVAQYQNDLATSHNNIGDLLREMGHLAEALE